MHMTESDGADRDGDIVMVLVVMMIVRLCDGSDENSDDYCLDDVDGEDEDETDGAGAACCHLHCPLLVPPLQLPQVLPALATVIAAITSKIISEQDRNLRCHHRDP